MTSFDLLFIVMLAVTGPLACDVRSGQPAAEDARADGLVQTHRLSDQPLAIIGGHVEKAEHQLGSVLGALRLSDGRVVVADALTRQVKIFDGDGRFLRAVGGHGSGPAEFQRFHSIARGSDETPIVWDGDQRRLTVLSSDGDVVRTVTNPAWPSIVADLQTEPPRHFLLPLTVHQLDGDRLVMQLTAERIIELAEGTQVLQDTTPLLAINVDSGDWTELGRFPGTEFFFHEGMGRALSIGERLRAAAGSRFLYAASTRGTAIQVISLETGQLLRRIALPWARRPTSPEDIRQLQLRFVNRMNQRLRSVAERYVDGILWPDSLPMFADLRAAADQRLWVRLMNAAGEPGQEWVVFEPSGEVSTSGTFDAALELLDAGADFVVVKASDGLDVEEVRVHRLAEAVSER